MIKQTITVNRKKYATGLFWQPVGGGNASYNHIKNLVKNFKQKYNLFIDYKSMIGFGSSKTGIRFGMPSAAVARPFDSPTATGRLQLRGNRTAAGDDREEREREAGASKRKTEESNDELISNETYRI